MCVQIFMPPNFCRASLESLLVAKLEHSEGEKGTFSLGSFKNSSGDLFILIPRKWRQIVGIVFDSLLFLSL